MPLSNLQTRDLETLIHPYSHLNQLRASGAKIFERGSGVRVFDSEGRDYIEGLAGLWCTSLGYSNSELIEAARKQMERLPFAHLFAGRSHDPAIELAEKLKEIAPVPISKIFFANSGSEANDTQMKLVWYMNNALGRPRKKKIISRIKAYHGVTIASASLTGLPNNQRDFDLPIANVLHAACPHHYRFAHDDESEDDFSTRLAQELESQIQHEDPETVAAFIAEPIMGAGGVIAPPAGYFKKVQAVLDRYDVFFIDDEVICGFGRLGSMFGAQALGMRPNSISVAKALTSAYLPLSAVMIPDEMYQAMLEESRKIGTFGHGFTYSGHPVAAAVGLKTLEIYQRDDIVGRVRRLSSTFWSRINALREHPLVGEARGLGMIAGMELVASRRTKRAFRAEHGVGVKAVALIEEEGVIARALGDTIALCPPLIISEQEIEEMFDKIARGLDRTLDWVAREGLGADSN